jgi:phosphatidylglycerophosphate synthase
MEGITKTNSDKVKSNDRYIQLYNANNYISDEGIDNMKKFRYQCVNNSFLYNNFTSPLLDKFIMPLIPIWVAPNTLTLLSFIVNLFTFLIFYYEKRNEDPPFTELLSQSSALCLAFTHLLYIILDNIDGKQARKTKSSTCLGLFFDHGFDTIITPLLAYNFSHLLSIEFGNTSSSFKSLYIFWCFFLGFWVNVYEEYKTGKLYFGFINGADEGNFIIMIGSLLSGIFGTQIWKIEIYKSFNLADFILVFLGIGTLQNLYQCIYNILVSSRNEENYYLKVILEFLSHSFNLFAVILLPYLTLMYDQKFFYEHITLILVLFSLIFCRIIIEMQVYILTGMKYKCSFIVQFSNILYWNIIYFLGAGNALNAYDESKNFTTQEPMDIGNISHIRNHKLYNLTNLNLSQIDDSFDITYFEFLIGFKLKMNILIICLTLLNFGTFVHYFYNVIIQIKTSLKIDVFRVLNTEENKEGFKINKEED